MRLPLLVSTVLVLSSSIAAAQPAATAPAATATYDEVNPHVALGLSLGLPAAGVAMLAVIDVDDQIPLMLAGVGLVTFGPTSGHWYQGRIITPGLVMRTAGAAALFWGLGAAENIDDDNKGFNMAMTVALLSFGVGTIYDIATAPIEARKTNTRNRERAIQRMSVAPTVSGDHAGFVLAGRF